MKSLLLQRWGRIVLILAVFILFLSNAAGLVSFSLQSGVQLRWSLLSTQEGFALPLIAGSAEFLVLLVSGLVLSVALPLVTPIYASVLTVAAALPQLYLGLAAPPHAAMLPMEFAILTVAMIFGTNVLASYFVETQSRQKIVKLFGQYVPPAIVEEISRHPERLIMEGESKRLTVFFCDLQNFSSVAEQLNPKQLALLLNEYFTDMSEVLFRHGATIDKYIGDSIMAFWGAPLAQADHAARAVTSAFEMHRTIKVLQQAFVRRGWPAPSMGIGINTGVMNVGNMGSRYRVAYTVVGDAVNLASRLETLTRSYGVPTIVSDATRQECPGILFRSLDIVQVRGKHNRTTIYQPVCLDQDADDTIRNRLALHEQAMEQYFAERWDRARVAFERLRAAEPADSYYPAILRKVDENMRAGSTAG